MGRAADVAHLALPDEIVEGVDGFIEKPPVDSDVSSMSVRMIAVNAGFGQVVVGAAAESGTVVFIQ